MVAGALALILVQAGPGTDEIATQRAEVDDRAKVKTVARGDRAEAGARADAEAIPRVEKRLRKGRPVRPPTDAGDLAKYLRALAESAGVKANGSYLSSRRRDSAPARAPGKNPRPAFELLAKAINGKDICLEVLQADRWSFAHRGDPRRHVSYAASGGLITRIDYFSRRAGQTQIWTLARSYYDKDLARHVVATQMNMDVLEAVSSKGVKYPAAELAKTKGGKPLWTDGQQAIYLGKAHFPGDRIARLRVRGHVALRTGTAVLEFGTLGHKKPVTLERSGVTVTVSPLTTIKRLGKDVWQLPVQVRTSYEAPRGLRGHGETVSMFATDGKEFRSFGRSGSYGRGVYEMRIRVKPHSIDPSTTRMVITYPTGLKVAPYELTFNDVRIRDVPPRTPKP